MRTAQTILGWLLLSLFVVMVATWTVFGFVPELAYRAPEPFAALTRSTEFWPILVALIAGSGAAWALAPGLSIRGEDGGEHGVSLSPLAAAVLGPSALLLMLSAYWPCAGDEQPFWSALRHALEALEGYVAEPFGTVEGCPMKFPSALLAGVLFGKITLVLVLGIGLAFVFRRSIHALRARFARQVVVFSGLDVDTVDAARALCRSLTERQRLVLLDTGPQLDRARELAREVKAIVLSIDVTDSRSVEAFMSARGARGIHGLYLLSPDAGANVRAMNYFLRPNAKQAEADQIGSARLETYETPEALLLAEKQRALLESHIGGARWRSRKRLSGLAARPSAPVTEVPARVVIRIDNPWHAEDWRQRQMSRQGWLFDAVSINEVAARHVVRQAVEEGIEEFVVLGQTPFELAVLSELALARRVDQVLSDASAKGSTRTGSSSMPYVSNTPRAVLLGPSGKETVDYFRRQLARFGVLDSTHHISVESRTMDELMEETSVSRALVVNDGGNHDSTFLASRHPRWRMFAWAEGGRGLTVEPMLGRLSLVGPSLEPVPGVGFDVWERLGRVHHAAYLYQWAGGVSAIGDRKRGNWDTDLNSFAKEGNVRSFSTFCRTIHGFGLKWGTDLGADGAQAEHVLTIEQLKLAAMVEHDSWVRHHLEYGWRLGAPDKIDGQKARKKLKLHPDIVEWAALSDDEQRKDVDSAANTAALMRTLGFTLVER